MLGRSYQSARKIIPFGKNKIGKNESICIDEVISFLTVQDLLNLKETNKKLRDYLLSNALAVAAIDEILKWAGRRLKVRTSTFLDYNQPALGVFFKVPKYPLHRVLPFLINELDKAVNLNKDETPWKFFLLRSRQDILLLHQGKVMQQWGGMFINRDSCDSFLLELPIKVDNFNQSTKINAQLRDCFTSLKPGYNPWLVESYVRKAEYNYRVRKVGGALKVASLALVVILPLALYAPGLLEGSSNLILLITVPLMAFLLTHLLVLQKTARPASYHISGTCREESENAYQKDAIRHRQEQIEQVLIPVREKLKVLHEQYPRNYEMDDGNVVPLFSSASSSSSSSHLFFNRSPSPSLSTTTSVEIEIEPYTGSVDPEALNAKLLDRSFSPG
ncbi:MAG TPA: hypothetical protein VJL60_04730 [Gammaproteobacteria bacterium]|nr:hypothetical protein [Gammaproteobacteria bacterium]